MRPEDIFKIEDNSKLSEENVKPIEHSEDNGNSENENIDIKGKIAKKPLNDKENYISIYHNNTIKEITKEINNISTAILEKETREKTIEEKIKNNNLDKKTLDGINAELQNIKKDLSNLNLQKKEKIEYIETQTKNVSNKNISNIDQKNLYSNEIYKSESIQSINVQNALEKKETEKEPNIEKKYQNIIGKNDAENIKNETISPIKGQNIESEKIKQLDASSISNTSINKPNNSELEYESILNTAKVSDANSNQTTPISISKIEGNDILQNIKSSDLNDTITSNEFLDDDELEIDFLKPIKSENVKNEKNIEDNILDEQKPSNNYEKNILNLKNNEDLELNKIDNLNIEDIKNHSPLISANSQSLNSEISSPKEANSNFDQNILQSKNNEFQFKDTLLKTKENIDSSTQSVFEELKKIEDTNIPTNIGNDNSEMIKATKEMKESLSQLSEKISSNFESVISSLMLIKDKNNNSNYQDDERTVNDTQQEQSDFANPQNVQKNYIDEYRKSLRNNLPLKSLTGISTKLKGNNIGSYV